MDTKDVAAHFQRIASGKVRDIYALDADKLLFCTTDRISAYDVILDNVRLSSSNILLIHIQLNNSRVFHKREQC